LNNLIVCTFKKLGYKIIIAVLGELYLRIKAILGLCAYCYGNIRRCW